MVLRDVASAKLVSPLSANTCAPHWTANGRYPGARRLPCCPGLRSGSIGSRSQSVPESPGRVSSSGCGRARCSCTRFVTGAGADQKIGEVLEPADRLVTVEKRCDLALHPTARRTEPEDPAADQRELDLRRMEVRERAESADAVNLRGPGAQVVDVDKAGIEVEVNVRAWAVAVHLGER